MLDHLDGLPYGRYPVGYQGMGDKMTTEAYWRGFDARDVGEGRIEGIPCLSHDCRVAALEAALQEGLGLEPAWQLGT